jgi:hypothetical protein
MSADSFDWKGVLGAVAPTVATVLGGPLAGLAVEGLGKVLGIGEPTVAKVKEALASGQLTGEQIAGLKQAEIALQVRMRELEITEEQIHAGDVDSARKREAAVLDHTNRNIAYVVVGAFIAMVAATLLGYAKVESVLAGTLVGYLSAKCEQVLAYYFGSSSGSAKKTELLAKAPPVVGGG